MVFSFPVLWMFPSHFVPNWRICLPFHPCRDATASAVGFIVIEEAVANRRPAPFGGGDDAAAIYFAVSDGEAVENGTGILIAVEEESSLLSLAVDPAVLWSIRTADGDGFAPEIDVAIAGTGVDTVRDENRITRQRRIEGCLKGSQFRRRIRPHHDGPRLTATGDKKGHQSTPDYGQSHALAHVAPLSKDRPCQESTEATAVVPRLFDSTMGYPGKWPYCWQRPEKDVKK
jgi:hypothetical protein